MTAQTPKAAVAAYAVRDADIMQIVEAFHKSSFNRLELRHGSTRLSLSQPTSGDETVIKGDDTFDVVVSPSVGFFHDVDHSETPAEKGPAVTSETILGVVKTLNSEIEVLAELSGKIVRKLAEDGDFIAYGQPLFYIRPDSTNLGSMNPDTMNIASDPRLKAGSKIQ